MGFVHDLASGLFNYDSKFWRTMRTLVLNPGQLTVEYVEGRRASYLTPPQLYLWLETICFLVFKMFFPTQAHETEDRARIITLFTAFCTISLAILGLYRRRKFVEHLVFSVHLSGFLLLILVFEYSIIPLGPKVLQQAHVLKSTLDIGPILTILAIVAMVPYSIVGLRRFYKDSVFECLIKVFALYWAYYLANEIVMKWMAKK